MIAEVIQYEGDNSTFIWKHPCEDFNSLTRLIVHESQEAVFFMNGQALDLFGPGRYTLETENIPMLGRLLHLVTGQKAPFHCEVYFINKAEQMSVKWGTDSKVQYVEPVYGFPISIGASGEMSLRVADSQQVLMNIVGTERCLTREHLVGCFRAFMMTKVKTYIAQVIKAEAISIFEIDEKLMQFSQSLYALLAPDFAGYGMSLEQFFVTNIVKPDGDRQYEKFKELHFRQYADVAEAKLNQQTDLIYAQTAAQKVVIDSQAQAAKRAQEGYTYAQERGFDVAEKLAQNEATGQFANIGLGLGAMAGVAAGVGGTVTDAVRAAGIMTNVANTGVEGMGIAGNAGMRNETAAAERAAGEGAGIARGAGMRNETAGGAGPAGQDGGAERKADAVCCPSCGTWVARGKFCMECGYRFDPVCPQCGAKVPDGAKFCMVCGSRL